MASKIALGFVVAVFVFQMFSFQSDASIVIRREAPATTPSTDPTHDLEELLQSAQKSISELVDKVQTSELYQNATQAFQEFGKKVKDTGDELYAKITNTTQAKTRK